MPEYEGFGNTPDYVHEPQRVVPIGLITDEKLVLKYYNMFKKKPADSGLARKGSDFLMEEIENGRIEPYIGLGFAILSNDMLNVCRWDKEYPIVLKNQIYGFEESRGSGDISFEPKLLDIRETGPFCVWELGIVSYERDRWKEYLASKRAEGDKLRYLSSFIEGEL